MEIHIDVHLLHTILHKDHISPSSQNNTNNTDKHNTFFCYFSLQMQTWTYSLSNNSDYYVIKHRHDTVSLQIQIHSVPHNSNSLTSNYRLFRRPPSTPKITPLTKICFTRSRLHQKMAKIHLSRIKSSAFKISSFAGPSVYSKGRESYHSHKHSQTHKNFFLNILFLILILDLPCCQMVVIQ